MNQKTDLTIAKAAGEFPAIAVSSPQFLNSVFLNFAAGSSAVKIEAVLSADEAEALADSLKQAAANARLPRTREAVEGIAEIYAKSTERLKDEAAALNPAALTLESVARFAGLGLAR